MRSDQHRCSSKILSAYIEGDAEEIKRLTHSGTVSNLDSTVMYLVNLFSRGLLCANLILTGTDYWMISINKLEAEYITRMQKK